MIQQALDNLMTTAQVWEHAEEKDGYILLDLNKATDYRDHNIFLDNRRWLKFLGWTTDLTAEGWELTPPPEPQAAPSTGASPIERAKFVLARPASNWDRATVEADNRTVRLPASRNPYENLPIRENLSQLRQCGWDVGESHGPRGVIEYVAVAPAEKVAPATVQQALAQVSRQRVPNWIKEGREVDGWLVFSGCSLGAINSASGCANKASAHGWSVEMSGPPDKTTSVRFQPPQGLIQP